MALKTITFSLSNHVEESNRGIHLLPSINNNNQTDKYNAKHCLDSKQTSYPLNIIKLPVDGVKWDKNGIEQELVTLSRAPEFNPAFFFSLCWSILSFLCNNLQIIVLSFHLFSLSNYYFVCHSSIYRGPSWSCSYGSWIYNNLHFMYAISHLR